ncbi:hypothetical protein P171DRAFT_503959 [Karstenula rhodostoma CBS 690.94]|uniref:Cyanovirin-N domain-containing protein n=1 Tax=Karstenula rhodostoma CBS 690.94 TaxID=1392251 RepID=A0A9P4PVA8_9PLEO|nr:hypothetical protein P171DRAFT_503959 [Karstenula rhodostoma CBS 690.94]
MLNWELAALTVIAARSSYAAPAVIGVGVGSSCTNVSFTNSWLIADCLTKADSSTHIQSSVYLNNKITNDDGTLKKVDGSFLGSCNTYSLGGAKLTCSCQRSAGYTLTSALNLKEHIANYAGRLLSDLSGPPAVPPTSSAALFPSDPSWPLRFGDIACYSPDSDFCSRYPFSNPGTCGVGPGTKPESCYAVREPLSGHVYRAFAQLQVGAPSKAWRVEAYGDLACTEKVGSVEGEEQGTCKKLGGRAVAVKTVPLWNADV